MYTLLRERHRAKDLFLQVFLLVVAFFSTEVFVENLVERLHLFPESFTLESLIFVGIWLVLDFIACSVIGNRSILGSFFRQGIAQVSLSSFLVSLVIAELFFKFYNFGLELLAMLGVWSVLDFASQKLIRKSNAR
ncbi:hypothetical protein NIES4073_37450 [Kalymmatonema gypsitolerans NIES-4073]|nr:hypothetical protein NIES4073_37450 [Scytonema sp. NIES-4073]